MSPKEPLQKLQDTELCKASGICKAAQDTYRRATAAFGSGDYVTAMQLSQHRLDLAQALSEIDSAYFRRYAQNHIAGSHHHIARCLHQLGFCREAQVHFDKSLRTRRALYQTDKLRSRQASTLYARSLNEDEFASKRRSEASLKASFDAYMECNQSEAVSDVGAVMQVANAYLARLEERGDTPKARNVIRQTCSYLKSLPKDKSREFTPERFAGIEEQSNLQSRITLTKFTVCLIVISALACATVFGVLVDLIIGVAGLATMGVGNAFILYHAHLAILGKVNRAEYFKSTFPYVIALVQGLVFTWEVQTASGPSSPDVSFFANFALLLWPLLLKTSFGRRCKAAYSLNRVRANLAADDFADWIASKTPSWFQAVCLDPTALKPRLRFVFRAPLTTLFAGSLTVYMPMHSLVVRLHAANEIASWWQPPDGVPPAAALRRIRISPPSVTLHRWTSFLARSYADADPLPA